MGYTYIFKGLFSQRKMGSSTILNSRLVCSPLSIHFLLSLWFLGKGQGRPQASEARLSLPRGDGDARGHSACVQRPETLLISPGRFSCQHRGWNPGHLCLNHSSVRVSAPLPECSWSSLWAGLPYTATGVRDGRTGA